MSAATSFRTTRRHRPEEQSVQVTPAKEDPVTTFSVAPAPKDVSDDLLDFGTSVNVNNDLRRTIHNEIKEIDTSNDKSKTDLDKVFGQST